MNQPSGTACVQREKGFLDTAGDYFEIVSTTDTEGDTAKTMTAAEDVLTADDDLAGFFCINDMGALGCVQAAQAAGKGAADHQQRAQRFHAGDGLCERLCLPHQP